jgi:hypothetical protein
VLTATAGSDDTAVHVIDVVQNSNQSNSTMTALHQPAAEPITTCTASTSLTVLTDQVDAHITLQVSGMMHDISNTEAATSIAAAVSNALTSAVSTDADIGASIMKAVSIVDAAVPAVTTVCTALQHVSVCSIISMVSSSSSNGDSADHDTGISDAADPYNTAVVFSTVSDNMSEVDATQAVTPISAQTTPSDESAITSTTGLHDSSYSTDVSFAAAASASTTAQAQFANNEHHQNSQSTATNSSTSTDYLHTAAVDVKLCRLVLRDGVTYIGTALSGQPHGFGTAYMTNGSTYTGNWLCGYQHGQGTLVTVRDGIIQSTYIGKFCYGMCQEQDYEPLATDHTQNVSRQYASATSSAHAAEALKESNKVSQVVPRKTRKTGAFRRFFAIVQCEKPLQGSLTLEDAGLLCRTKMNSRRPVALVVGLQMQSEAGVFKYILYIRLAADVMIGLPARRTAFTVTTAAGNSITVLGRHQVACTYTKKPRSLQQLEEAIRDSADVQHVISAVTFSEGNFMMVPSVSALHN